MLRCLELVIQLACIELKVRILATPIPDLSCHVMGEEIKHCGEHCTFHLTFLLMSILEKGGLVTQTLPLLISHMHLR